MKFFSKKVFPPYIIALVIQFIAASILSTYFPSRFPFIIIFNIGAFYCWFAGCFALLPPPKFGYGTFKEYFFNTGGKWGYYKRGELEEYQKLLFGWFQFFLILLGIAYVVLFITFLIALIRG